MNAQGNAARSGTGRYLVLVGAVVVQLILGTVYGYSIFWQPLTADVFPDVITAAERDAGATEGLDESAYLVVADDAARARRLAVQQGYLKYAFSICILSFAVVMVIAGRVQDVTGPRLPALIGAVLMSLGFFKDLRVANGAEFGAISCTGAFLRLVLLAKFDWIHIQLLSDLVDHAFDRIF